MECEGSSSSALIWISGILAGDMSQKGKEPEAIGDTSSLSPLKKGPTLKSACSCSSPTTTKKTPESGRFSVARDITRDYYPKQSARFPVGRLTIGESPSPNMELGTAGLEQRTVMR